MLPTRGKGDPRPIAATAGSESLRYRASVALKPNFGTARSSSLTLQEALQDSGSHRAAACAIFPPYYVRMVSIKDILWSSPINSSRGILDGDNSREPRRALKMKTLYDLLGALPH